MIGLMGILLKQEVFQNMVEELKLGGKRGWGGVQGCDLKTMYRKDTVGVRAFGGGRKGDFQEQKDQLKVWVETERAHGNSLNHTDLWTHFTFMLEEEVCRLSSTANFIDDSVEVTTCRQRVADIKARISKVQGSK